MAHKIAIIIGAGPAGLTAAYELLDKTDIKPVVFEATNEIGGISKTVNYKGNRIDTGGHRFFSKSTRVMNWWKNILPLQGAPARDDILLKREIPLSERAWVKSIGAQHSREIKAPDPEREDKVMLVRQRLSRIFFLRKFFDYPISLSKNTLLNLGIVRIVKIGLSYVKVKLFPIKHELSLEDFFINRFGKELYRTFFKHYTEKVWGVSCEEIRPEWGAQRVKGLSVRKALSHALKSSFSKDKSIEQKGVETSLIEQFIYPKLGPGQMWEEVSRLIKEAGGEVRMNQKVVGVRHEDGRICEIEVEDPQTQEKKRMRGDLFFSSMPLKDLIMALGKDVPEEVKRIASGLKYRSFLIVGLLLDKLKIKNESKLKTVNDIIPDNWIYIQEKDVKVGRLQIFNNWSPYLVADANKVWIGAEYFCDEEDELWNKKDEDLIELAKKELSQLGIIEQEEVGEGVVIKVPKAYPAYFGTYDKMDVIKDYVNQFENLFLIGRNGMHRYNNQDHSMLSAMIAVENILNGVESKDNIWSVNIEAEYHEEKRNAP
ncbi:MAG: NAD(P)/FAD-dependent oxidoreductase, partial [Candidatus Zixiibacteriota bacterium]